MSEPHYGALWEKIEQDRRSTMTTPPPGSREAAAFVPVKSQCFDSKREWINKARWLTQHDDYNNTEHGDTTGWRGAHFTAMCFDQLGRRCRNGGDFERAEKDGAYPIWWVWPDQIADLIRAGVKP